MSGADEIIALERQRCAAIASRNADVLGSMLSSDYVHIHGTGRISDADDFIKGILASPRITERHDLSVRLFGTIAVMVGGQTNRTLRKGQPDSTTVAMVTQVLQKVGDRWRYVSFQLTPYIEARHR